MTTVVLASSFLSASLLTMLVPMAVVVAMLVWGVVLIRRQDVDARDRATAAARVADASLRARRD